MCICLSVLILYYLVVACFVLNEVLCNGYVDDETDVSFAFELLYCQRDDRDGVCNYCHMILFVRMVLFFYLVKANGTYCQILKLVQKQQMIQRRSKD